MGIKVEAEKISLNKLVGHLDQLSEIDLQKLLGQSAALVEASAKDNLITGGHVKTGELVRSIQYRVNANEAEVFTTVPYATYVEFGTGSYAENGNGRPGWWVYVDESCGAPKSKQRKIYSYDEACRVWHMLAAKYGASNVYITNGQKPTRFMRNALDDNINNIKDLCKDSTRIK